MPYVQFCASNVMQSALSNALPAADKEYEEGMGGNYYEHLRKLYTKKRNKLAIALMMAGFGVCDFEESPGGGFFIFARLTQELKNMITNDIDRSKGEDWAFCEWLAKEKGILMIPSSPFFRKEEKEGEGEGGEVRGVGGREGRGVGGKAKTKKGKRLSDDFVRVAFCKTDETIDEACEKLRKLRGM